MIMSAVGSCADKCSPPILRGGRRDARHEANNSIPVDTIATNSRYLGGFYSGSNCSGLFHYPAAEIFTRLLWTWPLRLERTTDSDAALFEGAENKVQRHERQTHANIMLARGLFLRNSVMISKKSCLVQSPFAPGLPQSRQSPTCGRSWLRLWKCWSAERDRHLFAGGGIIR